MASGPNAGDSLKIGSHTFASRLIVGTGNVGLIIGYQLHQAGVEVEALIDIRPEIGGYLVHASKLVRLGVPLLLGHTITAVHGEDHVIGASIAAALRRANLPENEGKAIVTIAHDRGDRYLGIEDLFVPPPDATEEDAENSGL